MKKIVFILPLILLVGCTNKVEENKYAYLDYKNNLEKQEIFSKEKLDFNSYFNIKRENKEVIDYSIIIDNPTVNMHQVKALLIHDYTQDEIFPSIGILDEPVELLRDSNSRITLKGKIQTIDDIKNIKFKLYIEYIDDNGTENKIYYKVSRG